MEQKFMTVKLTDGSESEIPVDNLENVQRIFAGRIQDIIIHGEEYQEQETLQAPKNKGGRPKRVTN